MTNKKKRKLQTLIFDQKFFPTKKKVRDFVKRNGFTLPKYKKNPVLKYENTYRARQRPPGRFKKTTFRTFPIFINKKKIKGVKGVYGYLK